MSKEIATQPNTSTGAMVLDGNVMSNAVAFAEMMAQGISTVPKHLQGSSADCLAVTMQAMQWNMNPFAVAQKTHVVSGALGYEAQLVNAVISSSTAIDGRFHYEYSEPKTWEKANDPAAWVRVGATLKGETEIQWGEPLYISTVTTKNSPLWKTNPKQQGAYLGLKYWSRLYTPAVIMGVYTSEELQEIQQEEKDITPGAKPTSSLRKPETAEDIVGDDIIDADATEIAGDTDSDAGPKPDEIPPMTFAQVIELISVSASREELSEVMDKVVAQNTFAKGTEEHDKIKAKLKAKKQYFTTQERAVAGNS